MNAEHAENLHAELGYRTSGQREVRQREWFSLRGDANEPLPTPKAFAAMVNRLRVKKWVRENREKHNAKTRRFQAKPGIRDRMNRQQNVRRRKAGQFSMDVHTCPVCQAKWCKVPWVRGVARIFCGQNCQKRAWNRARRSA